MYYRMLFFINKHTLLSPSQFCFRQYKNITDVVADFVNFVTGKLDVRSDVDAC